ncbi:helix-turn-helix domain-containing protein [Oceanobacillus sp. FSL K6-0118]|uniref:helix-turn-helix domain-containing protein n=1 Tax=Oceanobacillus sp. FSL K6-0118 TaxID=2921418 RepID=UPI0030F4D09C
MKAKVDKSMEENKYYTTLEAAQKLGLSVQTIRRMCTQGKFKGVKPVSKIAGHWLIPKENFITTREQDKIAEITLQRIDKKNKEKCNVDEFDL